MGQYYKIVNIDKKEYLHPHAFGDGLKLMEFGSSAGGTLTGLAILLADGNGHGGGDFHEEDVKEPIAGRWKGDKIVIAGDYADPGSFIPDTYKGDHEISLYEFIDREKWDNISAMVIQAMKDAGEWERK